MKNIALWTIGALVLGGALAAKPADALPIEYSFSSTTGASIVFEGDGTGNFAFDDGNDGHDFLITLQDGGDGTLQGLFGNIDGIFVMSDPGGGNSTTVTTTDGIFSIKDNGDTFEADIDFVNITVAGSGGTLMGTVFYSSATYGGTNTDLQALATAANGPGSVTFQIAGGTLSLDDLFDGGARRRLSYSGSSRVTAVPEPATLALLGVGLAGLGFAVRRRREDNLAA